VLVKRQGVLVRRNRRDIGKPVEIVLSPVDDVFLEKFFSEFLLLMIPLRKPLLVLFPEVI